MKYLKWLAFAAIIALAIFHLKPHLNELGQVPSLLRNARYSFLALSALSIIGQYVGDGYLSQILLQMAGRKIKVSDAVRIASVDVFAAHLLPLGEVGTIATITYFYKKIGVTNQEMIFLTVTWGLATNVVLIAFLLVALATLPQIPNVPIHVSSLLLTTLIIVASLLLLIAIFRKILWQIAQNKLSKFSLFVEIKKFFGDLNTHINTVKNSKRLVIKALIASLIYYVANIASLHFAFLAFGHPPSLAITTVAYLLSLVISFLTLAPAGIGTSEAVMFLIFHQFGVDTALTVAGVLTFRLFSFWLPIPAGFLSYLSLKNRHEQ